MAEKGLVRRNEKQRAHIYEAARPREWTQRQLAGDLLQRAFDGSARSLMMGALSARKAIQRGTRGAAPAARRIRKGGQMTVPGNLATNSARHRRRLDAFSFAVGRRDYGDGPGGTWRSLAPPCALPGRVSGDVRHAGGFAVTLLWLAPRHPWPDRLPRIPWRFTGTTSSTLADTPQHPCAALRTSFRGWFPSGCWALRSSTSGIWQAGS